MVIFPKYESYKESEVPDLGIIPEHWSVIRNRFLFKEKNERSVDGQEIHLCMSQKFGLIPSDDFEDKTLQSESYEGARLCEKGDLVLNRLKAHLSVFATAPCDGLVSPDYSVFRLNDSRMVPKYFEHLFKTPVYLSEFNRRVRGIVAGFYRLYSGDFDDVRAICPPIEDQKRIVDFLDRKTTEIDQAIAQKQRLIELLQEQKAILINQSVTKGLNPNVPMRDSGIEWIGEVPEAWNTTKLKYVSKIFRGKFTHRPRNDPHLYDGQYPFIQTGDVAKAGKFLTEYKQTLNEKGLRVSTLIPKETVVITIAANIGDISILGIDACFPDSVVGFQPKLGLGRDFLYYTLLSMKQQFINTSTKNTQMNLNVDRIGSNFVPVPDLVEQQRIVEWIEDQIFDATEVETSLIRNIHLLNEYRSIVIAQAVTGKIKI
jgi:type I restriction enzyme, S subunit